MSHETDATTGTTSGLRPTDLLVWFLLRERAGPDMVCTARVVDIARDGGLGERSVWRAIQSLESAGRLVEVPGLNGRMRGRLVIPATQAGVDPTPATQAGIDPTPATQAGVRRRKPATQAGVDPTPATQAGVDPTPATQAGVWSPTPATQAGVHPPHPPAVRSASGSQPAIRVVGSEPLPRWHDASPELGELLCRQRKEGEEVFLPAHKDRTALLMSLRSGRSPAWHHELMDAAERKQIRLRLWSTLLGQSMAWLRDAVVEPTAPAPLPGEVPVAALPLRRPGGRRVS